MDYILYIVKFIYKLRFWLTIVPLLVALIVFLQTANMARNYTVNSTIYTGVISGFNILSENQNQTSAAISNSIMDNLFNIIHSDHTLKEVSLRLYARSMINGNPQQDNMYIKAVNYRKIYNHAPQYIRDLIVKDSPNDSINEARTLENLHKFEKADPKNYVYGIYNWNLEYYNRTSLKNISARRDGKSDMLELSYSATDPGLTYQTLKILCDEFIKQYQDLRFGETNDVIKYFEGELARYSRLLKQAEDSLTDYSIAKRVINYDEETKQVSILNSDYDIKYWEFQLAHSSTQKLIQELERRLKDQAEVFRNNSQFISTLNKISTLYTQISQKELFSNDSLASQKTAPIKKDLQKTEDEFYDLLKHYGEHKYTKEGIANEEILQQWLGQVILLEKTKAELEVMKDRKKDLDNKYVYFSPIGSTLKRKERNINIIEAQYMAILNALNAARLRQKSLQMTSATLKIINPPEFPLYPEESKRKKIVAIAFAITFIFILGFFILVEFLDRTLHNSFRTKRITGGDVLGAYTRHFSFQHRKYNTIYQTLETKALSNSILTYLKPDSNNIVNILSTAHADGKSFVSDQLFEYWNSLGMDVKQLSWHSDFDLENEELLNSLLRSGIHNKPEKMTIILVEYPPLEESSVTQKLLQDVSLNLLVVNSRRTWKNTDQALYTRLKELSGSIPLFFILNHTKRNTAEEFTGLLPPYTFWRKLLYRLSQLGLTAIDERKKQ
ncbi:exopolysaccharide biosynthesis protein [uncultured Sanguibacteroides sp.]|uniref:GumC family protein n=1 Tax=uncultured Sanguibacteroides sp. TaxID=1635151 RepID=UPI0025EDC517|nr:exopolysaccharide biosynthesis protein [uncultured Sanguibacteroides sp.]